jgi:hypothetical protein
MSAKYLNTIQEESTPVYGWITDYWDQADWIQWHKKLNTRYGLAAANEIFIKGWNDSPWFAANISFRNSAFVGNCDFIDYAKANEFYEKLFSGFFGTIFRAQSAIVGGTKDIAGGLENVTTSAKAVSSYLLPVAIIGIIAYGFFYVKKHKLI